MSLVSSTLDHALARIDDGHRRILVWGPPGAGLSALLASISRERSCETLEARSQLEAHAALRTASAERPLVLGWVSRYALDADAYVECARPSLDECVRWLDAALLREGVSLAHDRGDRGGTLGTLALAAEQTPDALARIPSLLRVLSPSALLERCEAAKRGLRQGSASKHPLFEQRWPELEALSDRETEVLAIIVAAEAGVELDGIERVAADAGALEALLALRDRSIVYSEDGRWIARYCAAARMLDDPRFRPALGRQVDRRARECVERASVAIERWRTVGDSSAIAELDRDRAALEAAASALASRANDPVFSEQFVCCARALALAYEPRDGLGPVVSLLTDALSKVQRSSEGWAMLAVELARAQRLRTEWSQSASLLEAIDVTAVSAPVAAAFFVERAFHRRFDDPLEARALMLRAHEGYGLVGYAHEQAQCVIGLGSLEYWQQRLDEALAHYRAARDLSAKLGARKAEAVALTNMCLCLAMLGDDVAATAAGAQAVSHFRSLGDGGAEGTTLGHLGMIALQRGQLDQAECRFVEAEALLERAGYLEQLRNARLNRAEVDFARGNSELALRGLEQVEGLLAVRDDAYVAVHVAALRADVFEAGGRFAEGLAALDRGLRAGAAHSSTVAALIAPRRVRLLARARQSNASAVAARQAEQGLALVRTSEHRVAATIALGHAAWLRGEREEGGLAPAISTVTRSLAPAWVGLAARRVVGESVLESLPIRHATALYWADLGPSERTAIEWSARDPSLACVCIDEALGVARLPGGATLTRSARRNAFQLLAQLASSTATRSKRELIEALWPDERIQRAAAANRLSNAVAQLRALGGAALVRRDDDRYSLSPETLAVRSGALWTTLESAG